MTDITKAPITAKLTILRIGGYNFRSLGVFSKEQPYHIVDFTKINNTLVVANENGSGKSTLYKHLLDYCLTGVNSVEKDNLDSLINSANKSQGMSTFIEFHSNGKYYKSVRGRGKLKAFDIYTLVNGDWKELEDLPVSDRDRQNYLYSLLGMERSTAETIISNTISLGVERFNGVLSMSAQEQRSLMEPIFDITIFAELNKETKSLKANKLIEQQQTLLEIKALDTKVALAEQAVVYSKQDLASAEANYSEQEASLIEQCSDCSLLLEEALNSGADEELELREAFSTKVEANEVVFSSTITKLQNEMGTLGEFTVDNNLPKLVQLRKDVIALDTELSDAKTLLDDKKASLANGELEKEKAALEADLKTLTNNLKVAKVKEETLYEDKLSALNNTLFTYNTSLDSLKFTLTAAKEDFELNKVNITTITEHKEDAITKEKVFQGEMNTLQRAKSLLEQELTLENTKLTSLVHAGECPTCKQNISKEYIAKCKEDINSSINSIKVDINAKSSLIAQCFNNIEQLNVESAVKDEQAILEDQAKLLDEINKLNLTLSNLQHSISTTEDHIAQCKKDHSDKIISLQSGYNSDVVEIRNSIDSLDDKASILLGETESNYKSLLKAHPSRLKALEQQTEDYITLLSSIHSDKKKSLEQNYTIALDNNKKLIEGLQERLQGDIKKLKRDKECRVEVARNNLVKAENTLKTTNKNNTLSVELCKNTLDKVVCELSTLQTTLLELQSLHDQQESDIKDYEDMLVLFSDKEGKAEVLKNYMPQFNKDINTYLQDLGMFIDVEVDNTFNITMNDESRKGQSLHSLSVGQKAKVNLSVMLALRDVCTRLSGVDCNILILDEILGNFSEQSTIEVAELLKNKFSELSLVVISQNKAAYSELFTNVKEYSLVGGFTTEVKGE